MDWGQITTAVAGAFATAFVLTYAILARWWRSQEGQNVVMLSIAIIALCAIGTLRRAGWVDAADFFSGVAWGAVAAAYAWRTILLLRAQGLLARRRRVAQARRDEDTGITPN